ncbi:MAG: HRDC domain-containing protein [Acholeplasma sp.]|nr:HRDC domain-containing protein [Acholeplasma sp.]
MDYHTIRLTSSARTTALNNNITIYNRDRVIDFLNELKKKDNIFFRTQKEKELKTIDKKQSIEVADNEYVIQLKSLRIELSEKYKFFPIYNVFNNEVLMTIIEKRPKSLEELSKIKGLGAKKIELFGSEIAEFVNSKLIGKTKLTSDIDQKLFELLIVERAKIAKFIRLTEDDVYSDKVAGYIAKMKPKDRETLAKVYGIKKENIDIFGDYLLRVISKYIDTKNKN